MTKSVGLRLVGAGLVLAACGTAFVYGERVQAHGPRVQATFNLADPEGSPFPSNRFTRPDSSQLTGLRVNLPKPDCLTRRSDCDDIAVINTLDGFNLQPRLSIPFDGPVDPSTVTSRSVFLVNLERHFAAARSALVGINQIVWDPATNTVHAESDALLDQHTCYALIVTNGVRDAAGRPVEPSWHFRRLVRADQVGPFPLGDWIGPGHERFRCDPNEYEGTLTTAVGIARHAGRVHGEIVSASVFTTLSATTILERMRGQLPSLGPLSVNFDLGPAGTRTNFALSDILAITLSRQTVVSPPAFSAVAVDLPSLRFFPGAVGGIAYGKYLSPDYLVHPGEYMQPVGTRQEPVPTGVNEIYFNVVYPAGVAPTGGWPVAIYGHGAQGNKDEWMARVASSLAAQGIATIGINTFATGFGPLSTVTVQRHSTVVTFPSGGRSIDQDHNNVIGSPEGIEAPAPRAAIFLRDTFRQQVVDWMQLVRVIQQGVDYDDDGLRDLDASRIYFVGQSHGGMLGTILSAVEPAIRASVLNAAGGSMMEHTRLSGVAGRLREGLALGARSPSLLNAPGIDMLDGVAVPGPYWFENKPLRDGFPLEARLTDGTIVAIQSPVTNTVAGAVDIQRVQEWKEWCSIAGDPLAYAPHLRKQPLAGVPEKRILIQFYKGDPNVENPQTSALIRAGELADRSTYYRHDLAYADNPMLAKNPHQFFLNLNVVANRSITLALQQQAATFLAYDGERMDQPVPMLYFEAPIQGPLPETLNYIR
jgi:hypothetical protein